MQTQPVVAYFSMEIALEEGMPTYSGGLGWADPVVTRGLNMNAQELINTTRTLVVGEKGIYAKQQLKDKPIEHKQYIDKLGEDMPEIRSWPWQQSRNGKERASVVNPRL